jgi:hypothetical protein
MDAKLYLPILRAHSEYLAQLCTEVHTHLSTLEHALGEQNGEATGDTLGLSKEFADLQRRLAQEAETFCQRLQRFVEGLPPAPDPSARNGTA